VSDFLRGEEDEVASFFAFQDIIIAVLGIIILIALQLSFSMNEVRGESGKEVDNSDEFLIEESEFVKIKKQRIQLEESLSELRNKNLQRIQLALNYNSSGGSVETMNDKITILAFELIGLKNELEELENQKKGITDKSNWIDWVSKFNDNINDWRTGADLTFEEKKNVLRNLVHSINVVSDDKTSHKLVINLSVHYWMDSLNWNWKKGKTGETVKDGYWIGKGEDTYITQSISTKKKNTG